MSDILRMLLDAEAPDVAKSLPTKRFEVPRLSKIVGAPVVFTLRALPYGKVQDIRSMTDTEQEVSILLGGCIDPNLKSDELQEFYGVPTPVEAVRSLLLPGEIADLAMEVERLSGYRHRTIQEIKNG